MRIRKFLIAATVVLAMAGAQGCFYHSYGPDQYGPDYYGSGQYGQRYGSDHMVCDTNGNNCMICDANNQNCRRVESQYGSSQRSRSWGFWW
jgi:hypothetical protein